MALRVEKYASQSLLVQAKCLAERYLKLCGAEFIEKIAMCSMNVAAAGSGNSTFTARGILAVH